jgi:HEAT repeat protein
VCEFYAYRQATKAVRPSPEKLEEIRRHFHDRDSRYREWAAQLAGLHRDIQAIPGLLDLLQDDERDVEDAVYEALGRIGKPAVQPLLGVIHDASQSTKCRSRCKVSMWPSGLWMESSRACR